MRLPRARPRRPCWPRRRARICSAGRPATRSSSSSSSPRRPRTAPRESWVGPAATVEAPWRTGWAPVPGGAGLDRAGRVSESGSGTAPSPPCAAGRGLARRRRAGAHTHTQPRHPAPPPPRPATTSSNSHHHRHNEALCLPPPRCHRRPLPDTRGPAPCNGVHTSLRRCQLPGNVAGHRNRRHKLQSNRRLARGHPGNGGAKHGNPMSLEHTPPGYEHSSAYKPASQPRSQTTSANGTRWQGLNGNQQRRRQQPDLAPVGHASWSSW